MSLDTVLKIGKALRQSKENLRYFKYVSPCPTDKDGNYPFCVTIPVLEDFTFDWNNIQETPENERKNLYYLRFKTSDSDGLMKYIFGDIYYQKTSSIKKDGTVEKKEAGGYRLENPDHSNAAYRPSSFTRGEKDSKEIFKLINDQKSELFLFRNQLNKDLDIVESLLNHITAIEYYLNNPTEMDFLSFLDDENLIESYTLKQLLDKTSKANLKKLGIENGIVGDKSKEKLLSYDNGEIFVHFSFYQNFHWYKFPESLKTITGKMLSDFVDESENGLVLKKTLYKTLCSGDKKNDIQFPGFHTDHKHKSKKFSNESIQDLFYAIEYTKKGKLISGTDIKVIVLPRGEKLSADDYIEFQRDRNEKKIRNTENQTGLEPLFDIFEVNEIKNIISFDVVFSKKGGTTSPDVDLSEISGIDKSSIQASKHRIANIAHSVYNNRKSYFLNTTKQFSKFRISYSFKNILGSPQLDKGDKVKFKSNPKYQSHLLKVLPLIYTNSYYTDTSLITSFIRNTEFSIRAGNSQFNFLKFDLEFLISIQNNQNNKHMDIINSYSYQAGNMLGSLARNFSGENSPIKSFEKNYVGNLSRRISTLSDFIKLKNDIEQKLIMHNKTGYTFKTSYELTQKIKDFEGTYNKEECAFGFFESYFKPLPKKTNNEEKEIKEN